MSGEVVNMTLHDQPSILNVGYKVRLHTLPDELRDHNGKVGVVKALKFDKNDNGLVAVKIDNQMQDEKSADFIMMVRTTNVELISGNGYNKFTLIVQMPGNPDYMGEMIRCGQIKGGSTDGCPALVIGLDPAHWESFKYDIVEHMVAYSITDESGAFNYIRMLEEQYFMYCQRQY